MLSPEEAARFHGHKGPYLAWGYRAAKLAVEALSPKGIKDMVCRARVPPRTPFTCVLDGVQAGSCCTVGKGNLEVEWGDEIVLVFECNGRRLEIRPKADLDGLMRRLGQEEAFHVVLSLPPNVLFEVKEGGC